MFSLSFISAFFTGISDFLQQFNLGLKPTQNLSEIAGHTCKEGLVAGIPGDQVDPVVLGILQLPDRLDPLVLSRWTRSAVLGPRFHFKSFSSSIRSASGQYPRSSAVFSLCERSPAGDTESYRTLR